MTDSYDPEELAGTGRHMSPDELFIWTRFLDAGRLLEEVLSTHVSRSHNMTHSDYEVLVRLDGFGGQLRMTELADQVVSSAQKLTHTANRLERRGWIVRNAVAEDGRGLSAQLLEPGRAALAAASAEHAQLIKQFLHQQLSASEQKLIGVAMARIAEHLRLHRRGEHCPQCSSPSAETADP